MLFYVQRYYTYPAPKQIYVFGSRQQTGKELSPYTVQGCYYFTVCKGCFSVVFVHDLYRFKQNQQASVL